MRPCHTQWFQKLSWNLELSSHLGDYFSWDYFEVYLFRTSYGILIDNLPAFLLLASLIILHFLVGEMKNISHFRPPHPSPPDTYHSHLELPHSFHFRLCFIILLLPIHRLIVLKTKYPSSTKHAKIFLGTHANHSSFHGFPLDSKHIIYSVLHVLFLSFFDTTLSRHHPFDLFSFLCSYSDLVRCFTGLFSFSFFSAVILIYVYWDWPPLLPPFLLT